MSATPEEVLSYWFPEGFEEADPQTRRRQAQRWMAGDPEVEIFGRECGCGRV